MERKKGWKYGSYAVLMTIIAIAVFILIALLLKNVDWKIDMTQNKIYSLSKQTKDVISSLKEDINVYVFYVKGREDQSVTRLLETYKKSNPRLKIQYIDNLKNPDKVQKYSEVYLDYENDPTPVSVVFESSKRVKVINHNEMIAASYGLPEFQGEQKFTNALRFVALDRVPTIYYIQGHREAAPSEFAGQLEELRVQNYIVTPINLLSEKKIPDNADMVLVVSPKSDFMPEEITELNRFLNNGGKGIFFIGPLNDKQNISKLKDFIKGYGIEVLDNVAIEGNSNGYSQSPAWILPKFQNHKITEPIVSANLAMIIPYSRCLKLTNRNGYTVEALLTTSDNSWAKAESSPKTLVKEKTDLPGPLNLAAVSSKEIKDKAGKSIGNTKLVVVGSSAVCSLSALQNPGNYDFFLNIFGWAKGETEDITIRPVPSLYSPLNMNNTQRVITIICLLIFVPGAVIVAGVFMWTRRKHL
ncbi:MAG: GldG family protein [Deltaproteobacteria bacterium]